MPTGRLGKDEGKHSYTQPAKLKGNTVLHNNVLVLTFRLSPWSQYKEIEVTQGFYTKSGWLEVRSRIRGTGL